jgi:dTDP-4-amino-4,6-dideoxygalactose transaminase
VGAVHLYGQPCDLDRVSEFAARHGLALIEDAAQAHGARWRGRRVGGFGAAACFSFYPSKNLGALGDGGAICTDDDDLAERARWLRHIGQRAKGEHVVAGYNERLDGLQAAVLRVKLPYLDGWNDARRAAASAYRELLPAGLRLLDEHPDATSVHHLFPVRLESRDALARELAARGIGTGIHYHPAVPDQPPYRDHARAGACPTAAAWAAQELSLPMFDSVASDELERTARACEAALAAVG